MKKLLALCLTVAILLAMVPIIGVSAADAATFSVSEATGNPGDEVIVTVSIDTNPGLTFAQVMVGYYAEALEVVNIDLLTLAGKPASSGPITGNPLKITWTDGLADTTETGAIANVTFKIKEDAPHGDYKLTVKAEQDNVFNVDFDDVPFTTVNGKITVNCLHKNTTTHAAVDSTCTVAGNAEYVTCDDCDVIVSGSNAELPLAAHTWADVVADEYFATAASCTEQATYYKSCSVCAAKSDVTFATGDLLAHTWAEVADEKYLATEATCTAKATYYKSCSVCAVAGEETFEAGELLAHDWVDVVADEYFAAAATCEVKETYYKSCSVCAVAGEETFEVGELADHTYGEWEVTLKPTFDYAGEKAKVCSVCYDVITEEIPVRIPAEFSVSHNVKRVAPGETVEVVVSIDSNPGITGASLWLDYDSNIFEIVEFVDASLDGRETGFSTVDNDPAIIRWIGFEDSYATGTIATVVLKVKDDAADGMYDFVFSSNQDEVFDQDFDDVKFNITDCSLKVSSSCPDDEHIWTQVVADEYFATAATCDSKATYYLSCSECSEVANATFETGEFDANNHVGTTTTHTAVESTCTVAGNEEYVTCDDCGAVVAGSDAKLPLADHVWVEVEDEEYLASEATCTAKATYYKSCSVCAVAGEETFEVGELLEHNWADVVDDKYLISIATCFERAVYYKSCSECGETNFMAAFVDGKFAADVHVGTTTTHAAVESTCTVAGNEEYVTCDDCGAVVSGSDAKLPLAPHTWVEVADDKYLATEATCEAKATYYKSCSACEVAGEETFEYGDALGHDWVEVADDKYLATAATCTAKATYYKSCSRCAVASEETFEYGELAPHTFDSEADYACNACRYTLAPNAPVVEDATAYTITLVAVEGCEYSIDGINWQSSNVFEDLTPNTEYTFYQRIAATETHDASDISEATAAETFVLPGDVNADGVVNGKDCVILAQILNNWDVEAVDEAADFNGDGTINNKDLALVIRYLNGWED